MEITNIKENIISPSLQGSTPGRVKKSEQPDEQVGRTEAAKEPRRKVSKDGPEPIKDLQNKDLKSLTEALTRVIQTMRYNIQFVVDREAGGVVIKVLDGEGKLIRRIPPEVMAAVSLQIGMDAGLLVNTEL